MNEVDELLLAHFGTKGMKWGQRKNSTPGVSSKIDRDAKKDAREFARAKQFFGEGAGTRRKLIKATVEGKSAKNPAYAKAFQSHISKQDSSKHASKAVSERRRKDVTKRTKQRAGFLARTFTGEQGTQAAFAAAVLAGGVFLASPKGRALMSRGVTKLSEIQQSRAGRKLVTDFLKNQGGG
jgi:hypothetical protein